MPGVGGELVLPDQKGVVKVIPDGRTFQLLIAFQPKIVGGEGGGEGGVVNKISERSIFH